MDALKTTTCAGLQCPNAATCVHTLNARLRDAKWLDDLPATDMRLSLCETAALERFEAVGHASIVSSTPAASHPANVGQQAALTP